MQMFILGMITMYLIIGFVLVLCDGIGGIELFNGFLVNIICLPGIVFIKIVRFVNKKIIHRGMKQVWSREKGFHWVKKDSEV